MRRQCAVDVAHCAPLGAAGIMAPMGPFCKPRVFTRGYDLLHEILPHRSEDIQQDARFRAGAAMLHTVLLPA